jgi:hypothetical protein
VNRRIAEWAVDSEAVQARNYRRFEVVAGGLRDFPSSSDNLLAAMQRPNLSLFLRFLSEGSTTTPLEVTREVSSERQWRGSRI